MAAILELARRTGSSGIFTIFLVAILAGCASGPEAPRPPFVPPAVTVRASEYFGSPLSGPVDREPTIPATISSTPVQVIVVALERLPDWEFLSPIAWTAGTIVSSTADAPIAAVSRLARGGRAGPVESAAGIVALAVSSGPAAELGSSSAAVRPGSTTRFAIVEDVEPAPRRLEILLCRTVAGTTIPVTFLLEGELPASTDGGAPETVRELVEIGNGLSAPGSAIAFVVPSPFRSEARALLAVVEWLSPGSESESDVTPAATTSVGSRSGRVDAGIEPMKGLEGAVDGLRFRSTRRRALVHLARETGAELAGEVALTGSDDLLDAIAAAFRPAPPEHEERAAFGWRLERITLRTLAGHLRAESLPVEIEGLLVARAGEVGRHPSALEAIAAATSLDHGDRALVEENLIFLTDSAPSSRVRAWDWLRARDVDVPGYDPLAPRPERRAAMVRWADARDAEEAQP